MPKGLSLLGVAVLMGPPAPALAQQVKPICASASRACLIKTARAYIEGLSRHDGSAIPFAPKVRCTEQGDVPVTDEAKFRSEINGSNGISGVRNVRLLADPQTQSVGAFFLLDVAATKTERAYTVRRGQRFKIVGGLITEVEIFNYVDPKLGGLAPKLWPD